LQMYQKTSINQDLKEYLTEVSKVFKNRSYDDLSDIGAEYRMDFSTDPPIDSYIIDGWGFEFVYFNLNTGVITQGLKQWSTIWDFLEKDFERFLQNNLYINELTRSFYINYIMRIEHVIVKDWNKTLIRFPGISNDNASIIDIYFHGKLIGDSGGDFYEINIEKYVKMFLFEKSLIPSKE
jgi:hypothetical protein